MTAESNAAVRYWLLVVRQKYFIICDKPAKGVKCTISKLAVYMSSLIYVLSKDKMMRWLELQRV